MSLEAEVVAVGCVQHGLDAACESSVKSQGLLVLQLETLHESHPPGGAELGGDFAEREPLLAL